jgi:hypothetical protein
VNEQESPATTEELTRRRWFLRLGEMAALAGFSGLVPEIAAGLLGSEQQPAGLPPGLHTPSSPHLIQALTAHASPPGTEAQANASPFQPEFFSEEEFQIVTRLVEIVLGKVDAGALSQTTQWLDLWFHSVSEVCEAAQHLDPLHRALAVVYYGEEFVRELETVDSQTVAREGVAALRRRSLQEYGRGFLELNIERQIELLSLKSATEPPGPLQKFVEITRREAIRGYYTSAEGFRELNYKGNAYYLSCPGCEMTQGRKY